MELWLLALLPLTFLLVWVVVLTALGRLSGWHALARRHPALDQPTGVRYTWQSGSVGWVSYNNCLTLQVSPEGLYLAMPWPFRTGHPAMLLPWDELHVARVGKTLWFDWVELVVGDPPQGRLRLPLQVLEAVRQFAPQAPAGPEPLPPPAPEWQNRRTWLGVWRSCTRADGRRFAEFTSHLRLLGLPLLHSTFGLHPETNRRVVARGVIAFGRLAVGVIAVGHASAGVIAVGQAALGLLAGLGQAAAGAFAAGQLALGVVFGAGQVATGYWAFGQVAVGVEVMGQVTVRLG